jgi:D-alanyl-D-alanine carboxypeptidase/D-alanyl-D-alanine-endopeptidase (penicillin-binding protein 4)
MRPIARVLATFLALSVFAPALVPAKDAATSVSLASRLERRISRAKVRADRLGVCVVDLDDGAVVFQQEADRSLVPASVSKLLTAAAALDLLGPGHRFETTVDARGELGADGTLAGDLVVHGTGDPNLSRRGAGGDWTGPLDRLAEAVHAAGVRRVTGALVLDDGPFDRSFVHASWSAPDRATWVGAPVCGLTWNDGCISVLVSGGRAAGDPTSLETPAARGPWPLVNAVETAPVRNPEVGALWIESFSRLRVSGAIGPRQDVLIEVPATDPLAWFGSAFEAALGRKGVRVAQGARVASTPEDRRAGRRLAGTDHGLPETLGVMNRRSQNLYAALLFKACGVAREGLGSWESGERAVSLAASRRGVETGVRIVDGSGLSRDNRLTARAVARLLRSFDEDLLRGPILRASLAAPGEDGTLERRLRDPSCRARVRAKTGTLRGVTGLAGYVAGSGGSRGHAFAILLNGVPHDGDSRDLVDDLVREVAAEGT